MNGSAAIGHGYEASERTPRGRAAALRLPPLLVAPPPAAAPVLPPPPQFAGDERDDMAAAVGEIAQVIALICGILVIVLMALGLASADWLMSAGWRQGLFAHCIEPDAPTPLPFNVHAPPGCYNARDVPYIRAAAGLCIVTLAADVCGALLTAMGLRASDHRAKFRFYRLAVLAMALALISILIALVIYPVCFAAELNLGNRTLWEFGWAYGVGWGAAIFLFGAVVLLLCDKESEEIYYKERKVVAEQPPLRNRP